MTKPIKTTKNTVQKKPLSPRAMARMAKMTEARKNASYENNGAPTKWTDDVPSKVKLYIDTCVDKPVLIRSADGTKTIVRKSVKIPSVQGFAVYCGVHKETIYDWARYSKDLSDALKHLLAVQHERLTDGGLSGEYSPVITKLMMSSNHGYQERVANQPIPEPTEQMVSAEAELDEILKEAEANLLKRDVNKAHKRNSRK